MLKRTIALMGLLMAAATPAKAAEGLAKPWQLNFQPPASPVMEQIYALHNNLTMLITIITLFVLALLIVVWWRFRESKNKTPSKTTHHTLLEIVWTTIPILILVGIAIPSVKLHYFMDKAEEPEMTLKVVGYQWYWNYTYPDQGGFSFDSYMVKEEDLKDGEPRLLKTDNPVVVPVDTTIQVLVTAGDVLHSFAMPAFGMKKDAIPGRLNETWFKATKPGTYYGQCSELCGVGHGFMPVEIKVVSKEEFKIWAVQAQEQFAKYGRVLPAYASAEME